MGHEENSRFSVIYLIGYSGIFSLETCPDHTTHSVGDLTVRNFLHIISPHQMEGIKARVGACPNSDVRLAREGRSHLFYTLSFLIVC